VDDLVSRCLGDRRARRMRFYFLPEQRDEEERRERQKNDEYYDDNENSGCSYALVRTLVSFSLYRLLTQFLAFLRPFLSGPFTLPCTRDSCGPRLRLDLFFCCLSSSSAAAASSSSPSTSSRGYIQARCIPEPQEWKDLVKASRSLAYA